MAEMIPERLPRSRTAGDERVFEALRNLSDNVIVYYEPHIGGRQPDFVVILPEIGLLVIEVKGWQLGHIQSADAQQVVVRGETHLHPLRQARAYMNRLRDECRRIPGAAHLLHTSGDHMGRFIFPFAHIAILSNITLTQRDAPGQEALARIFPPSHVAYRDDLLRWEDLEPAALLGELRRYFDPFWPISRLSQQQVNVLRAVIHPEIILTTVSGSPDAVTPPLDLKVLDLRQERHARSIGDGHRIIYGVAGSGKTVLLIARAKLLAEDASRRIFFTCYNRALSQYLQGMLADFPNVIVRTFNSWAARHDVKIIDGESAEALGQRFREKLSQGDGDAGRFDAVLIDEAQDFACSWFQCAKLALKDPEDGDLIIVGDGSQSLYRDRAFTWKDAGIKAAGRTINAKFDLDRNYRNTRQMLTIAAPFANDPALATDDVLQGIPISPDTAIREGRGPMFAQAANRRAEIDHAVQLIRTWLADGVDVPGQKLMLTPRDIAVLYPHATKALASLLQYLQDELRVAGIPSCRLAGAGPLASPLDDGVKISTIQSVKGLQFPAVIIVWTDLLPTSFQDRTPDSDSRLLYVGLTRAESILAVIHSGPSPSIEIIKQGLAKLL